VALKDKINDDLKAALLGGDRFRSEVLRGLKAVILNEEVAQGKRDDGLDDSVVEQLIAREVKKRNESATIYDGASRSELAENERKEMAIISTYLPKQVSETDIKEAIYKAIEDLGVNNPSGFGQVIGAVKKEFGNSADGALVAKLVKEVLS
jgi:uncharacterized protein YqeY